MISNSILVAGVVYFLALYAQSGFGLTVTRPAEGDVWDPSLPLNIQWTTVSGDPQLVDVELTNMDPATFPAGFKHEVQEDLSTATLAATISDIPGLVNGGGYRVNFVKPDSDEILAQSAPFTITVGGGPGAMNGPMTNTTLSNSTMGNMTNMTHDMNNMTHDMNTMNHTNTIGANTQTLAGNHSSNPMSAGNVLQPIHIMGLVLSMCTSVLLS
ncbi:uncharacterized protein MELLADRAFT_85421 [Melampsora larici-populina 98AG31]|uniref:Secreted protein n=1 Tax=Melampsora larici-populina (strain 98AG31 / pathotype 3-4-7) TaxID=747676 RepID=F4RIM2_MELLP|nr:uncharacterized protein MELLADRAFT_85421 [Melampsora larici-populina 98AG31]EGG07588.1 secreted protein [Melampsora larici-populina 98AG31]